MVVAVGAAAATLGLAPSPEPHPVSAGASLAHSTSTAPAVLATRTGPPRALAAFDVTASPSDEVLHLSWAYDPASARTDRLHLQLFLVAQGATYPVAATIVGQTVEPATYTIPVPPGSWRVRATPENAAGFGAATTSPVVTVGNPCRTATVCVTATPAPTSTKVRLAAQGFLLGVTDGAGHLQHSGELAPLAPRQWRFSGANSDHAARTIKVSRAQILSDLWNDATAGSNGGYARTPWSDWNAWRTFVEQTVRTADRQGWAPDYWDVWNEPNGTCCPKFSPADRSTITVSRWLQAYEVAWQAIKAADPHARVVGPSLSALEWAPGSPAEFDLDTFLAFSAAHGLRWDAVSWHENTSAPSPGDLWPSITNVDRHVAMAKAVMRRHPGTVAGDTIMVNEYGPRDTHALAGWAVGFFTAFENDGVQQANLACWSGPDCTAQLDGLLTPAGQPTAAWWAHRMYAVLGSQTRLAMTSTADWQVDGLATRDDHTRTVRVLLGRHWTCNRAVNASCANPSNVGAASVALTVGWPYGNAPVVVTTQRVPAGTGAVAAPATVHAKVVRTSGSRVTVVVPSVQDGDALWVVVRPR